ncbi:hypothetical protein ACFWNT_19740 [Streptomyces sp. NPDC058409]|uniref:hypothetical protein n=1 Tax=Streptomyces sp. NPDC058409 TaxID=3346484 RepID=UPI0036663E2F
MTWRFSVLGSGYVVPYSIRDDPAEDDVNACRLREAMGSVESTAARTRTPAACFTDPSTN